MGLGKLTLVAFSEENLYLSNNPQITFFKTVYKKYTNFSTETISQFFKITPDFGRRVTVNLSKNADLLHQIYLYIELPSLPLSNHSTLPGGIKKVSWVDKIGLAITKFVDLEIGGILIDRQYGDWLNIWQEITNVKGQETGYKKMIGLQDDLIQYSNSKDKYSLHIPLNFWFCQDSGLALPLIALTHHDVKIHVEFNEFSNCIKESPNHYFTSNTPICLFKENELIEQVIDGITYLGRFIYFDIENERVYYNKVKGDFQIPTTDTTLYKITGKTTNFEIHPKKNTQVIEDETYFYYGEPALETAYLLVNYVYLDNKERWKFINNNHEYLVTVMQNVSEQTLYNTNNTYKIPLVNPTKAIFWRAMLNSNKERNDQFNYSTYPITDTNEDIIEKHSIYINSMKRVELDSYQYYSNVQNHQYNLGNPDLGIYSYAFCLNTNEHQPSGSLNFSKIDDSYLQVSLNSIVNYQNPVNIRLYALQYNVFNIIDGLGGLKYYL